MDKYKHCSRNTKGHLPTGFAVDTSTCSPVSMFGGVVWATERPLDTLDTAGPQTLSPLRPWRPATVHYRKTKLNVYDCSNIKADEEWRLLCGWKKSPRILMLILKWNNRFCVFDRLTGAVWIRLAALRPSSLTNTNLTVHLHLLARPVAHTCHLTHTLLW